MIPAICIGPSALRTALIVNTAHRCASCIPQGRSTFSLDIMLSHGRSSHSAKSKASPVF